MTTEMPPQPTDPPATLADQPLPTAPLATPKTRLTPLLAGLLGLAVGAALVGGAWAYTSRDITPADPATFTLTGTFTLTDGARRVGQDNCRGTGGYDDINEGTSVTVYDGTGAIAATGNLGTSDYATGYCVFDISVADVPKGEKFYQVEVSHRGKVQLTAEEAEGGQLAATLG
ncbi:hypothetical protein ACIPJG_25380 [Streptomyces halstedii]|uniref:hypothetical protein n=1 Tax=Streptomyces halstedii TaxID=1944 RepID=UPI00380E136E